MGRQHVWRPLCYDDRMQQSRNDKRLWRRTRLTQADGSLIPDDWTLEDDTGQPLGRIFFETGGPQGGRWFWAVLVAQDGTPFNGGTGHAATGREAREAVEARVSEGVRMRRR
jgi:hypothetical protein